MRFFAIPILILLLMTQTFSQWIVVISFNVNRDYIAKNLCENRYRPKLNCKGNCVLMKKMKQEQKNEQNVPGNIKVEIANIVLSSRSYFAAAEAPVFNFNTAFSIPGNSGKPVDRTVTIFHPPSVG